MRLHPGLVILLSIAIKAHTQPSNSVGMPMQRVVPEGGCVLAGRYFKQGTLVGQDPLAVHLDERAYGKDAGSWRPDRWIEDRAEVEKYNLTFGQFSSGREDQPIDVLDRSRLSRLHWQEYQSYGNVRRSISYCYRLI